MVPVIGWMAISIAQASVASSAFGKSSLSLAVDLALGGASRPSPQLLCPALSFKFCFQTSHASRDSSVSSSCSSKPMSFANFSAPSPTSMIWSVCSMTSLATLEGVLILRIDATEPQRRVGPCITLASSSTTPSSLGRPPHPTPCWVGSNSTVLTPATTASRVSPPDFKISIARPQQAFIPLLLAITMFLGPAAKSCSSMAAVAANAAEVRIKSRLAIFIGC